MASLRKPNPYVVRRVGRARKTPYANRRANSVPVSLIGFSSWSRETPNSCEQGVPALGPVTQLRFDTQAALGWAPLGAAVSYDVIKGDLPLLVATAGDFATAISGCLENNGAATGRTDAGSYLAACRQAP